MIYSWNELSSSSTKTLKVQFKTNPEQKLKDLQNHNPPSLELVNKAINLLCSKKIKSINEEVQKEFFKSLKPIMEIPSQPESLMQSIGKILPFSVSQDRFQDMAQSDILAHFCYKLIRRNQKVPLATQIAQLIPEFDSFTGAYAGRNLALFALAQNSHFAPLVKVLIEKLNPEILKSYLAETNQNGETLLHLACKLGLQDLIPTLINYGADVSAKDRRGNTPLSLALKNRMSPIIQDLTFHMVNFSDVDQAGNNYIVQAIREKCFELIPFLAGRIQIDQQNHEQDSALHIALNSGCVVTAIKLLNQGANALLLNRRGLSPLFLACEKSYNKVFKKMLGNKNLDLKSADAATINTFIKTLEKGDLQSAVKFFRRGFCPRGESMLQILPIALKKGYEEIVQALLRQDVFNQLPPQQQLECLFQSLKYKSEAGTTFCLDALMNPNPPLTELKDYFAKDPAPLAWFFSTFLSKSNWKDTINWNMEETLHQIIDAAVEGKITELGSEFFTKAEEILSHEKIQIALEQKFKSLAFAEEPDYQKVVHLLTAIGNYPKQLIQIIQNLLQCVEILDKLSLKQARLLSKFFPTETSCKLRLGNEIFDVNTLILSTGCSRLRPYLIMNGRLQLKLDPFYFKKMYDFISEGILDFSGLEQNHTQSALKDFFKSNQIELPLDFSENIPENYMKEFLKKPYLCKNKKTLKIDFPFEPTDLPLFLDFHPDVEVLKIDSRCSESPSFWDSISQKLPRLKQIHLGLKNSSRNPLDLSQFVEKSYLFCLDGLETISANELIHRIQEFQHPETQESFTKGLVFSNRIPFELPLPESLHLTLENIQYLHLSDISDSHQKMIEIVKACPTLKELHLTNCQCLTDEDLLVISTFCPQLSLINLEGSKTITPNGFVEFVKKCPQLDKVYLSSMTDESLLQVMDLPKPLSIYIEGKEVLHPNEFKKAINIDELINLVDQNWYLLENHTNHILDRILSKLSSGKNLPSNTGNSVIKLMKIRTQQQHSDQSFISSINKFSNFKFIKFFSLLSNYLSDHTLDEFLPKDLTALLYAKLCEIVSSKPITLNQARAISKLFKANLPISVTESSKTFYFHSLILLCASKELKILCGENRKIEMFSINDFMLRHIHSFLEEGRVNLTNLNIEGYVELCMAVQRLGLELEPFLKSAKNKIEIKLTPSTNIITIDDLLGFDGIKKYVTSIDFSKCSSEPDLLERLLEGMKEIKYTPIGLIDPFA